MKNSDDSTIGVEMMEEEPAISSVAYIFAENVDQHMAALIEFVSPAK